MSKKKTKRKGSSKSYVLMFRFLHFFPLTKRLAGRITTRVNKLAIYGQEEIPRVTVNLVLYGAMFALALMLGGLFLFEDVVTRFLCFAFGIILFGNVIDKKIDRVNVTVLKRTKLMIASIEQEYMKTKSISAALAGADGGKYLNIALESLKMVIDGSEGEKKLQAFFEMFPYRPLQTLAVICYNINDYGDTEASDGTSRFVKALGILRDDVNSEIERLALQKSSFSRLEYIPILSVFLITPTEMFFKGSMSGTELIYNSVLGFVLRSAVIALAIVGYLVVSHINRAVVLKGDDRGFARKFEKNSFWNTLIKPLLPKTQKQLDKLKAVLQKAGSKMSPANFYTKKIVYFFGITIGTVLIFVIACNIGSNYMRTTTSQLSLMGGETRTEDQRERMRALDDEFFAAGGALNDEALIPLIQGHLPELTDFQIQDEMKRIRDKYDAWINLYFKYYYILIALALGIIGYFVPNLMMFGRAYFIKTETEDDFMQLETLTSILIYTNIDTLGLLKQLMRQSTVHKEMLREAYHGFSSSPELELEKLRTRVTIPEFKIFVDKIKLTISELSMEKAFADLISEREYFLRLRGLAAQISIRKKSFICKILSFCPVVLFAIAEFAMPVLILGIGEYTKAMGAM